MFCDSLWAKSQGLSSDINVKPSFKGFKEKVGSDQSDLMPSKKKFGFIGTYTISYDGLEPVKPKTNKHRLSLSGAYGFDEYWSVYGGFSLGYESYKMNIFRYHDSDPFYRISDLNLGVVHTQGELNFLRKSSTTFNIGLPVSERSRVDKHVANLSLSYFMESYAWKGFYLFDRTSVNYLWNTRKFSLFLDDQMSSDWFLSNSLGLKYVFLKRFDIRFLYRANMKRYVDGSWDLEFGNNLSFYAYFKRFYLFVSMINKSYQENDRIDLGYYDPYRRVFIGGVTCVF